MAGTIKFYTDEHIPHAVVRGLRARGLDVLSVKEAGLLSATDAEHLERACGEGRVLVTCDADFLRLAPAWPNHAGIAFAPRQLTVGAFLAGLGLLYDYLDAAEMVGHIEFL